VRQRHARDVDADLLGNEDRARKVRLGEHQRELVAAVAGRDVRNANVATHHVGDGLEKVVAPVVAETVVGRL